MRRRFQQFQWFIALYLCLVHAGVSFAPPEGFEDVPLYTYPWANGQVSNVFGRVAPQGSVEIFHEVTLGNRVTGVFNYHTDRYGDIHIGVMSIDDACKGDGACRLLYNEMEQTVGLNKGTKVTTQYALENAEIADAYFLAIRNQYPHLSSAEARDVAAALTAGGKQLSRRGFFPVWDQRTGRYVYTYGLDSLDGEGPFNRQQYEAWHAMQAMPFHEVKKIAKPPQSVALRGGNPCQSASPAGTGSGTRGLVGSGRAPQRVMINPPLRRPSFTATLGRTTAPYARSMGISLLTDLVTDEAGRESLDAVATVQFEAAQKLQIRDEKRTWWEWVNLQMAAVGPSMNY